MCNIQNNNVQVNTVRTTETSKFTKEITRYWFLILTVQVHLIAQADDNFGCVKERLRVRGVAVGGDTAIQARRLRVRFLIFLSRNPSEPGVDKAFNGNEYQEYICR
jgi:hypothetical protein